MTYDPKWVARNDYGTKQQAPARNVYDGSTNAGNATRAQVKVKAYWDNHKLGGKVVEIFSCLCTDGYVEVMVGGTGTAGARQLSVLVDKAFGAT